MKKKYISFSLVVLLLSTFFSPLCYAKDTDKKPSSITLTLETAINRIEDNNPEIKALDSKIPVYEKQYKDDVEKQNKAYIKDPRGKSTVLDIKRQKEINWRRSLLSLKNARYQRKEKLKNLKTEVEKMYIEIAALQNDISNDEEELSIINKKMEEAALKSKFGYIKQSDLKAIEAQKVQLDSKIVSSKNNLKNTMSKFKTCLGIDEKTSVNLDPLNYDFLEFDDSNINEKIKTAVDASYDVKSKKEELDILELEKDLTLRYSFVKDTSMIDSINMNISDKEEEFNKAASDLEISLLSSYYNLKVLQNNVEIEKLNLESAETDLKTTQSKVSVGATNKLDELLKANAVSKQKNVLQRAINSYTVASHELESRLLIDIEKNN